MAKKKNKAKKKTIYTSLVKCVSLAKNISVLDYSLLPNHDWIKNRAQEMLDKDSSPAEKKFMELCRSFQFNLLRQVYFNIDGRGYFLDFFLPKKNLAIEIDGRYHNADSQKIYDRNRDEAFLSIGIRTIRFTTDEMRDSDFYEKYYCPRLKNLGYVIRPVDNVSKHHSQLIRVANMLDVMPENSTLEVQSTSTSILYAISARNAQKKRSGYQLLLRIYETAKRKKVRIVTKFIGKAEKMKPKDKAYFERRRKICDSVLNKTILVV